MKHSSIKQVFTSAFLILALALSFGVPEPVQAERGFLNNLFSGGQRGRNRRAAAAEHRAENRSVQAALNFFGFGAGDVDGVLGSQSRAAIISFQNLIEQPATGQLSEEQKVFLLAAEERLIKGDEEIKRRLLLNLVSPQEVLLGFYQSDTAAAATASIARPSMQRLCATIGAAGAADLVTAQFCNLRQLTILGRPLSEPALVQCRVFVDSLSPILSEISTQPVDAVLLDLERWAQDDARPATLARTAKTCLGIAYEADEPDLAFASALALAGMGKVIFIELSAYHIAYGIGFEGNRDFEKAQSWLASAISRLPSGTVVLTGQESADRAQVMVDVLNIMATLD